MPRDYALGLYTLRNPQTPWRSSIYHARQVGCITKNSRPQTPHTFFGFLTFSSLSSDQTTQNRWLMRWRCRASSASPALMMPPRKLCDLPRLSPIWTYRRSRPPTPMRPLSVRQRLRLHVSTRLGDIAFQIIDRCTLGTRDRRGSSVFRPLLGHLLARYSRVGRTK